MKAHLSIPSARRWWPIRSAAVLLFSAAVAALVAPLVRAQCEAQFRVGQAMVPFPCESEGITVNIPITVPVWVPTPGAGGGIFGHWEYDWVWNFVFTCCFNHANNSACAVCYGNELDYYSATGGGWVVQRITGPYDTGIQDCGVTYTFPTSSTVLTFNPGRSYRFLFYVGPGSSSGPVPGQPQPVNCPAYPGPQYQTYTVTFTGPPNGPGVCPCPTSSPCP
jgi:hypothetical protein